MTCGDRAALRPETAYMRMSEAGALTVRVRHEAEYVLVTVAGEADYASVAGLRERLFALTATGRPLVADLDRVSFIDAAGLGVLAGAARRAAAHGGSLAVVCARPRIRQLIGVAGLDRALSLAGTADEALGLLSPGAKAVAV